MDRFSITDRLESTTPVRDAVPRDSARGDAQPHQRKRDIPKNPNVDEPSEASPEDDSHQIDELA